MKDEINFEDALEKLGIKDFKDRIIESNSRGELFHCYEYIDIANNITIHDNGGTSFRDWFIDVVKFAEENWERPESVFQHISKMLYHQLNQP